VEVEELKEYDKQIMDIQARFEVKQSELIEEIERLNLELDALSSNQLEERIQTLEKKQSSIEQLRKNEQEKEIELYRTKYEAGVLVIKDIIESLQKLKSQYDAVAFNDAYRDLSDPNHYPQYVQNIEYLKKKLVKRGLSLPEIDMLNPFLNAAYGVTRAIVSGQPDKDQKARELNCILDFTLMASQELNIVKYDLIYLEYSIDKLLRDSEELFRSYTRVVDYNKDFATYISDPNDQLAEKMEAYFHHVNGSELNTVEKEVQTIKYQLQKVMDGYIKYELFISQNTAYYEKFELIINEIEPTCPDAETSVYIREKYRVVKERLSQAKDSFISAFSKTIKQSYLKELIQ
jgi:hypothetical protein